MTPPFATIVERHGLSRPEAIVDHFGAVLLDGQLSPAMRKALLDYLVAGDPRILPQPAGAATGVTRAAGGPKAPPSGLPARPFLPAFIDQKVRGVVYLMLASPEYQYA